MSISEQEFLKGAMGGDVEVVKSYLAAGGDPNVRGKRGQTALMLCIWGARSYEVAKLLVEAGADLTAREEGSGWRPLTYAAVNCCDDILRFLFDRGDTVAADGSDWKALLFAVQYRCPATVAMLLEHGAAVDARDDAGMTSLMRAARNSDAATLSVLLDSGADVNLTDAAGMTALMYASGKANVENIRLLLERGASAQARNNAGESALELARAAKKNKVVAALEAHMAAGGK
jgi:uncharacterized protein